MKTEKLCDLEGNEVPSITGVVEKATATSDRDRQPGSPTHKLELELANHKGRLIIPNATYRINRREEVKLYSRRGFKLKKEDDMKDDRIFIDCVEIIGDDGLPIYKSIHSDYVEYVKSK